MADAPIITAIITKAVESFRAAGVVAKADADVPAIVAATLRLQAELIDAFVDAGGLARRKCLVALSADPGNLCTQFEGDDYSKTTFDTSRMASSWDRFDAFRSTKPGHVTTVTVAPGATLSLDVKGCRFDNPDVVALTLRAEDGQTIGVPTVAVDQLRAAGLVL